MNFAVRSVTIDCPDPYSLAKWWCAAFGVAMHADDCPGDPAAICDLGPDRTRILFEGVLEEKTVKNRVHIDLVPNESREDAVDRLLALGASFVADHRDEGIGGWVVLADPEGNEFCVERAAEKP